MASWQQAALDGLQQQQSNSADLANAAWALGKISGSAKLRHLLPPMPWRLALMHAARVVLAGNGSSSSSSNVGSPRELVAIAWGLTAAGVAFSKGFTERLLAAVAAQRIHLKAREWAQLLASLAKQGVTPPLAWQRCCHAVLQQRLRFCSGRDFGSLAWSLGQLGVAPRPGWRERFFTESYGQLFFLSPSSVCALAWGLGRLRWRPPRDWQDRLFLETYSKLAGFRPGELAGTLHGLARLQLQPPVQWMWQATAVMALAAPDMQPQEVTTCLWALSKLRYRPPEAWLAALADRAAELLPAAWQQQQQQPDGSSSSSGGKKVAGGLARHQLQLQQQADVAAAEVRQRRQQLLQQVQQLEQQQRQQQQALREQQQALHKQGSRGHSLDSNDEDEQQQSSSQQMDSGAAAADAQQQQQQQQQQQRALGAGDIRVVLGCLAQLQFTLHEEHPLAAAARNLSISVGSTSSRKSRKAATDVAQAEAAAAAAQSAAPAASAPLETPRERREFKPKTTIKELLRCSPGSAEPLHVGQQVEVRGWLRTVRAQKQFAFMQVNDGSTMSGIQVVVEPGAEGWELLEGGQLATGAAVCASGQLVASPGAKQAVELKADRLVLVGGCDAESYPLQKKRHTLEFLRGIAHLRPRTNTIAGVARVRSALSHATHTFFQGAGFQYVHTPILSASDCEGAGEMFQVTTLLSGVDPAAAAAAQQQVQQLQQDVATQGAAVKQAKAASADADKVAEEVAQLKRLKGRLADMEAAAGRASLPLTPGGQVDFSQDFFGEKVFLTVSGQLNGEMYASALGDIYTFGPTFRAENSNTSRHLAEFWMIEPELAFADLADDMACAEAYLKHCVRYIMEHCPEDLAFFDAMVEKGLLARLQDVLDKPFATVTYTEAIKLLLASGKQFEYPVAWGIDLQSEHERYLSEVIFAKSPLIVTDYPKDIKAFYMRLNDDGQTVAAMDLLVPKVGELIGGSQREERLDVLTQRMAGSGLDPEDYWWYLDLRRYGSVPHAGFGLGFERLVQFSTGVENIRDVIPFPRYPSHCKF
ncbi:hypothetical protein OEZ86_002666 [Tetradesmus obliquus]|nr:hypothetical protein OEZ86_002666 [Tetradesmus obliquus]